MGLKDKASKIDFASLVAQHAAGPDKQPKTAPGAMMAFANDTRSELLRENEELKARSLKADELEAQLKEAVSDLRAWDGAKAMRLLDPGQITSSSYANRHASSFLGAEFEALRREISEAGGNVQPIKVRPRTAKGEGAEFEIVYGHRRHEACRQLGLPVLAVIDNLDDRTLFAEMDRENRERADLSPWEQGAMYAKALERGLFSSNRQLASALGIDLSNLGKSLALSRLPEFVINAFQSPLDIQLRWAPLLSRAIEQDAAGVQNRAAALAQDRQGRSPKGVLACLIGAEPVKAAESSEVVAVESGGLQPVALRLDRHGVTTIRVMAALSDAQRDQLLELVRRFVVAS